MNYPEHCNQCRLLATCEQKENMLANTEPVTGYADLDAGDLVCGSCLDDTNNTEALQGDTDSPAHCADCGVPLDMPLTDEGVEYVKQAIKHNNGCCRELWPVLFADHLN